MSPLAVLAWVGVVIVVIAAATLVSLTIGAIVYMVRNPDVLKKGRDDG